MTTLEITLSVLCIVLFVVLLWPQGEPEEPQPKCYADYPFLNAQDAAERGCGYCSLASACHEDSPRPPSLRPSRPQR